MASKVKELKPRHVPKVVVVEVDDDSGDAPSWNLLGDSFDDIKRRLAERMKNFKPEKNNRVNLDAYIDEKATEEYCEQFESKTLMHDVWQDVEAFMGVAMPATITIKVFEMEKEKYDKAMAEATDA